MSVGLAETVARLENAINVAVRERRWRLVEDVEMGGDEINERCDKLRSELELF